MRAMNTQQQPLRSTTHKATRIAARVVALVAITAAIISEPAHAQQQAPSVVIDNVTIVDVTNGKLADHRTITVIGNRIERIERATAATHARATLDGTGMFVIPGLWDMHVHAYFTNDTARFHATSEIMLPLFIVNGITGVRDLGSNLDATLGARDSIAAHTLVGPRMIVSGPMLDGPTTRYQAAIKVNTDAEAREAVRMLSARGVNMIKTQSLIPREAYFALADEAAKLGIPFEGHVPNAITAFEAITAKQRSFEHLIGVRDTATTLIAAIAKAGVWQCPTVINSVGNPADFASDPGLAYWSRASVDGWRKVVAAQSTASDSAFHAQMDRASKRLAQIKHMVDLGIPFLAGTDAPAGQDLVPGFSLHRELQLFVRAGLTPLQALQTATINPARYYGKTAQWGSVAEGKTADFVVLARNPLFDIANTRTVIATVADGRYYSPRDLDRMRIKILELVAK